MLKFINFSMFALYCSKSISKHLMLKFIVPNGFYVYVKNIFQNILCWSLSCRPGRRSKIKGISKHLMLKFIVDSKSGYAGRKTISKHLMLKFITDMLEHIINATGISKHLMLKFIRLERHYFIGGNHFKTSYVEVYRFIIFIR